MKASVLDGLGLEGGIVQPIANDVDQGDFGSNQLARKLPIFDCKLRHFLR
jgi:hypothetical protein